MRGKKLAVLFSGAALIISGVSSTLPVVGGVAVVGGTAMLSGCSSDRSETRQEARTSARTEERVKDRRD